MKLKITDGVASYRIADGIASYGQRPMPKRPHVRPPAANEAGKPKPPASRQRWVRGWVCNLLATLIILYGGWMVGREMIGWWASPEIAADPRKDVLEELGRDNFGDPAQQLVIQSGDLPDSLGRQRFEGDRRAAMAELRRRCRAIVRAAGPAEHPLRPSEAKMLATLRSMRPVAQGPSEAPNGDINAIWEIYQLDGPLPMVAGIRRIVTSQPPDEDGEVAPFGRRVVCWGLALAATETAWTLFTHHPNGRSSAGSAQALAVPLPSDAVRTLTLRAAEGGAIYGFRRRFSNTTASTKTEQNSSETPRAWMRFYDQWLAEQGFAPVLPWRDLQGVWRARFEHSEAGRIEIQLSLAENNNDGNTMTGTLVLTPAPVGPRE